MIAEVIKAFYVAQQHRTGWDNDLHEESIDSETSHQAKKETFLALLTIYIQSGINERIYGDIWFKRYQRIIHAYHDDYNKYYSIQGPWCELDKAIKEMDTYISNIKE